MFLECYLHPLYIISLFLSALFSFARVYYSFAPWPLLSIFSFIFLSFFYNYILEMPMGLYNIFWPSHDHPGYNHIKPLPRVAHNVPFSSGIRYPSFRHITWSSIRLWVSRLGIVLNPYHLPHTFTPSLYSKEYSLGLVTCLQRPVVISKILVNHSCPIQWRLTRHKVFGTSLNFN